MAHFGCKHLVSARVASLPFDAPAHDGTSKGLELGINSQANVQLSANAVSEENFSALVFPLQKQGLHFRGILLCCAISPLLIHGFAFVQRT